MEYFDWEERISEDHVPVDQFVEHGANAKVMGVIPREHTWVMTCIA